MKTRLITPLDYETACVWWPAHGWPGVPKSILPASGVVCTDDEGLPLAMGWLYLAVGVGVSWLEYVVTNPENKPLQSAKALKALVGGAKFMAEGLDYGVLLTTCRQKGLVKLYEAAGFTKSDENCTHLLMLTR